MTTRRNLLRLGVATPAALTLGLSACSRTETGGGSNDEGGGSTLKKLQDAGKITLAIADERPYSWLDGKDPKGATIAMHKKIFPAIGIDEIEVKEVDWNSLIPGLNARRFDAVSAGMSILPDRCKQAAFSDPEIMYTTALMVAKGNPKKLTDLDSVVDAGKKVKLAVLSGGIEQGYAEKLKIKGATKVDNAQDGMDIVANGRVDAFAMTAISLNWMADNSDAKVEVTDAFVQVIDGVEQIGAGSTVFHPDDKELLEAYNEELKKITSDVDAYMDLVGEYGFTEENLPPEDVTTKKLCSGDLG